MTTYFEYWSGRRQQYVPRDADLVEFEPDPGIEVVEHETMAKMMEQDDAG